MKFFKKNHLVFIFFIFIILAFFHSRGLFYPDEGYILNTAKRMIEGQILYKDFDFVYTPIAPFLASFSFLILGESILSARVMAFAISFATLFSLTLLVRLYTTRFLPIVLVTLLYVSWGPTHINFLWPSIVSISLGIIALFAYTKGENTSSSKYIFLSGVFSFLIFLTKQNLGLAAIASLYLYIFFQNRKTFSYYTFGITTGIIFFMSYLLATDSFFPFLKNFYDNLIVKIIIEKTLDTPIFHNISFYEVSKLIFYLSPLFVAIDSIVISVKNKSKLLLLPLIALSFFMAGFRPVTDYVHLSPLLSLTGLSLLPIVLISKNDFIKKFAYLYGFLYISVGFYSALFVGYYRWEPPLTSQHELLKIERVNIWVNEKHVAEIQDLINTVNNQTEENEKVFINYYAPMIYFLIDRPNATLYDYVSQSALTSIAQETLLKDLHEGKIELVITHELNSLTTDSVNKYIYKNYEKSAQIDEFVFWKLKHWHN